MCPEVCLFSKCWVWCIYYSTSLYKTCFFRFTLIEFSHTAVDLFPVTLVCQEVPVINSFTSQCKINLLSGRIRPEVSEQEKSFSSESFAEYYIAVHGLNQTFNLISLIQVNRVGCGSISCFVVLETRGFQCV